mmetsp:Transcript_6568/g.9574  ORF Transcript_6568/g.9574 Transcript_6568/m.9574 type:complete len:161 (-) Transcript_6568:268-750(-)|eukprot:CAMPEP_0195508404 /NCGR_PEP_ID=MMETSP0794_2-20130614/1615_1 /TAXON_ID=515487 /ORGANISM="Stephanopyxis turris, Strain CCMP 815" /LENGTH=160 /DNA_ID=CAMNT_0040635351 /DNA_START=124 /DNA_END=606 /DNA_ORIENTATION=+
MDLIEDSCSATITSRADSDENESQPHTSSTKLEMQGLSVTKHEDDTFSHPDMKKRKQIIFELYTVKRRGCCQREPSHSVVQQEKKVPLPISQMVSQNKKDHVTNSNKVLQPVKVKRRFQRRNSIVDTISLRRQFDAANQEDVNAAHTKIWHSRSIVFSCV